jgi:NAD+ diphosphatase
MNHYERSALNFFAANPLDRVTLKRRDPAWLAEQLAAPSTRFVPVWQTKNLFDHSDSFRAVLLEPASAPAWVTAADPTLLGIHEGTTYFAVNVPEESTALEQLQALGKFQDLWSLGAKVEAKTGALLAFAKAMTYWHQRHRFCGDCGSPTRSSDGGFVRICTGANCGKQHFPRTDPAIIVLVSTGERCLLARQASWPAGRYSVLAGFVEPGESLEDAVIREVLEESNIRVTNIHYHSSQPWPFPASLMLGYTAEATNLDLHYADEELEHARWISRAELADELRQGLIKVPPPVSISHRLIESWFDAGEHGKLRDLIE